LRLIYVIGPSGAGKDSLLNGLRQEIADITKPPPLYFAQRTITRNHHQSNEDHEAVEASNFDLLINSNAFALNWFANGLRYGVRHKELAPMSEGTWVMVNGSRAYLEEAKLRFPGLTVLHITAPIEVLRARLLSRGRENRQAIEERLSRSQSFVLEPQDLSVSNGGSLRDSLDLLKTLLQQRTGIPLFSGSSLDRSTTLYMIRQYQDTTDRLQVVELWRNIFGYETAHNEPNLTISKKIAINDGLFFVAIENAHIVGTIMAGYDGHRGWIYSVSVKLNKRHSGIGSALVKHAELSLAKLGCMKIKLQILNTNESTSSFYASLGYSIEPNISMGKLL
jgi:ribose 1,5-bisphosphokinase